MDQFKELHKEAEGLKNAGYNTSEIKKDISNMEDEKEQLIKRVERLKRKVFSHDLGSWCLTRFMCADRYTLYMQYKSSYCTHLQFLLRWNLIPIPPQ